MPVRVIHGDCLDVMATLDADSVDAIVTDPPYTAAGGSTNGRTSAADEQFFEFWMKAVLREIRRVVHPSGCGFIFCDWRTIGALQRAISPPGDRQRADAWQLSQALVWDRECIGLGSPFRNAFEMIAFARGPEWRSSLPKDIPTVIRHRWPYGRHEHHGAEKPVALCRQLARWAAPAGGLVLDPFTGSGTTGVACALEGMRFLGIEREAEYVAIAERRIAGAQPDQGTLPLAAP